MSLISPSIHLVVLGNNNEILELQRYSDYLVRPSIQMQAAAYGSSLLDVLVQEAYISEDIQLRHILTTNVYADATRLIGNLAETLVVDYCNKYSEVNRTLAHYARFGRRESKNLDNYIAIGTASKVTERLYNQHYQPQDTQRDIIWIDKRDNAKQLACIGGTSSSSKPAGLQVKASNDGVSYVLPTILDYHYPILYFDLKDDWGILKKALLDNSHDTTLIHPDEIMREIKDHLKGYFSIIVSLLNGDISIKELVRRSAYNGDSVLLTSLIASELSPNRTIILR